MVVGEGCVPLCPAECRGLSFREWLLLIDRRGALTKYNDVLENNYDNVEQVIDLYIFDSEDGWIFDEQFLCDIGVRETEHRTLFEAWFAKACSTEGCAPADQINDALCFDDLSQMSFAEWLRCIDPSGSLMIYEDVLNETYDHPQQVVDLYMLEEVEGQALDHTFFDDVQVDAEDHRFLFESWFSKFEGSTRKSNGPAECGLPAKRADDGAKRADDDAPSLQRARAEGALPSSFSAWLREVDPSGRIEKRYIATFEEEFDSVKQVLNLYSHENQLLQLFEDTRILDAGDQRLFEAWFTAQKKGVSQAPSQVVVDELKNLSFWAWLRSIDTTGELDKYAAVFEEVFDDVAQLVSFYHGDVNASLDKQLFADMSITNAGHQQSLEAWFSNRGSVVGEVRMESSDNDRSLPKTLSSKAQSAFISWLRDVDPSGSLDRYQQILENIYFSPDQIIELYLIPGRGIDSDFFLDVGVKDRGERSLFEAWFQQSATKKGKPLMYPSSVAATFESSRIAESQPQSAGIARSTDSHPSKPTSSESKFVAPESNGHQSKYDSSEHGWMKQAAAGALETQAERNKEREKRQALQAAEKLKAADAEKISQLAKDEEEMTTEIGPFGTLRKVRKQEKPKPAGVNVTPEAELEHLSFTNWLVEVDPSGSLQGYSGPLGAFYENPLQVLELYRQPRIFGAAFDPQFFQDLDIHDPKHQKLFEGWFDRQRESLGPLDLASVEEEPWHTGASDTALPLPDMPELPKGLEIPKATGSVGQRLDEDPELNELANIWAQMQGKTKEQLLQEAAEKAEKALAEAPLGKQMEPAANGAHSGKHVLQAPTEAVSGQSPVSPAPAMDEFARWLHQVDPSGSLDIYLLVLQQGFDSVQQLLDAYVEDGTLDSAIFEDLGVEDLNHRFLLSSWFEREKGAVLVDSSVASKPHVAKVPVPDRITELKMLHFSEWLRQVDLSGSLDIYATILEESFDSVHQIVELYVEDNMLDPDFFADLGIKNENHKSLFSAWFVKIQGATVDGFVETQGTSSSTLECASPMPHSITNVVGPRFSEWLHKVDPSGELDQYCSIFEEEFDNVKQVSELYAPSGVLAAQFFEDLGVDNRKHQQIFRQWFENQDGIEGASRNGVSSPCQERCFKKSFYSFDEWLREVDNEHGLAQYGPRLSQAFNSVQEMIDTYIVTGGAFDMQFFTDFAVDNPNHRQLFEDWFSEQSEEQSSPKAKVAPTVSAPLGNATTFAEWLREVDGSGNDRLAEYLEVVDDNFDTVKQISELYNRSDDHVMQFFEDVGVSVPLHQSLFRNWFQQQRSKAAGIDAQAILQSGAHVRVKGLKQRPELNGNVGTLHSFVLEEGRWKVRLDDGSRRKLKPENIELA